MAMGRVRRDAEIEGITSDELRQKLTASRASGVSTRTVEDIFAEAREKTKEAGLSTDDTDDTDDSSEDGY